MWYKHDERIYYCNYERKVKLKVVIKLFYFQINSDQIDFLQLFYHNYCSCC